MKRNIYLFLSCAVCAIFVTSVTAHIVNLGSVQTREETDTASCQSKSDGAACSCDNKTVGSCLDGICENCEETRKN